MPKRNDGERGGRKPRPGDNPEDFDSLPELGTPTVPDSLPSQWNKKSQKIKESRAWQDGMGGITRFWNNYVNALKMAFNRLDRVGQEDLIMRGSQIVTVGAAIITTYIWYWFMPQGIRVIVLPIVLIGSWWLGTRVVAPSMIERFDSHLHPRED